MVEEYRKLFKCYLRICKKVNLGINSSTEEYRKCCTRCKQFREQLIGMVDLLCACGKISESERDREIEDIIKLFSTVALYHAYLEQGEVMVLYR